MAARCWKAPWARRLGPSLCHLPELAWGTELFGPLLLTEDISPAAGLCRFPLAVPTGLGLGIALDEDKLAHFRRDRPAPTFSPSLQEPDAMLFKVEMTSISRWTSTRRSRAAQGRGKAYSQNLQASGVWRHIWRKSGSTRMSPSSMSRATQRFTTR
jgi:hypothetical protein